MSHLGLKISSTIFALLQMRPLELGEAREVALPGSQEPHQPEPSVYSSITNSPNNILPGSPASTSPNTTPTEQSELSKHKVPIIRGDKFFPWPAASPARLSATQAVSNQAPPVPPLPPPELSMLCTYIPRIDNMPSHFRGNKPDSAQEPAPPESVRPAPSAPPQLPNAGRPRGYAARVPARQRTRWRKETFPGAAPAPGDSDVFKHTHTLRK